MATEPGVVDEDVDAAERLRGVEQRLHLFLAGDVGEHRRHPVRAELLAQARGHRVEATLMDVADNHRLGVFLEAALGRRRSDSRSRRRCYHDGASCKEGMALDVVRDLYWCWRSHWRISSPNYAYDITIIQSRRQGLEHANHTLRRHPHARRPRGLQHRPGLHGHERYLRPGRSRRVDRHYSPSA